MRDFICIYYQKVVQLHKEQKRKEKGRKEQDVETQKKVLMVKREGGEEELEEGKNLYYIIII